MLRPRILALLLVCAAALCTLSLRRAETQSPLRRITNTTEEGININPSVSGDGRILGFESTEDVAGAGGVDHFRAIRGNISVDPPTFFQMGGTRAVAPGISQDGSRIAFASKDDPLGTNTDGNSEIFLFNGSNLLQITNTSPGDPANRVINGNFQPSISDDGRFVAFSSNRDLASLNGDGNLEIVVYDSVANTFAQLTNSSGIVGFSDGKISGDASAIACIRDNGTSASTNRDLIRIARTTAAQSVLAANVQKLAMTYGRAISDDGSRVAYSGETATNSSQVFFYDGRTGNVNRQVTALGTRSTEVLLHPTMSGDGKRIAFATRRPLTGFSNSDSSVELYTYDIPTTTFARVTNVSNSDADCFDGSNQACEVVSSLNDDGSIVVFNFPRALSGAVTAGLENKSEIYATGTAARPSSGTLTSILNQASLGHEPSPVKAVAPNSIAAAFGTALANTTQQSQRQPDGTYPTNVGGTTVTVNGRAAQIFFVSPDRVHFLVPPQTEIGGNADVVITNADGFASRGSVPILRAAPGIFTKTGDGIGEGVILNSDTSQPGPFDPSSGNLRISIFGTGVRNAIQTTVNIAGRIVTPEAIIPSSEMPGLDEVRVRVPSDLRGTGTVTLSIQTDGRDSNPVTVKFEGDPSRNVVINEVLADPPMGIAGDANHDGARDGTQDEFVELVNGTASELISLSGWTIRTRATTTGPETTRFTFASGTSLPAGEAIVVFGGGGANFNPSDPIFGCAQVVKATTSSGLSLTNGGLTIFVRDAAGNIIAQFSYGGSTGLDGGNAQSLTRSPDVTGAFVQHTGAAGANGRAYSPGLRTNGTPFGNCPGHPASVTISPSSTTANVGETKQFTAQAFDQFGRAMIGVPITFASDNTTVATIDSTSTNSTTGVATANVGTHNPGTAHITATANDGTTSATSPQATLTVSGPGLSINDVSLNEGNSGATTFTFTVSLSQPAPTGGGGVKFDIATQDDTATVANNDYVARSLTNQTIAAGQQTYTFDVTVNGDLNIEPNERFFVNVTNVSAASVTDGQGQGTILNDDSPQLSINDVSASEGNSGTTNFHFTVTSSLSAPAPGITFDIATADGTATAASGDYVTKSLTGQTIPTGQQTYTFDVTVNGDTLVEPNETFFVNISNVSANASVTDGQGQGTIQNDDTPNLVISQVYGGGNNSGAPLRNDFVEIYNRGTTTVDFTVTPYSIQYAAVGSNFGGSQTNLSNGSVAPGKYFLVQEGGGTTNGVALPMPDATGSIAMGNSSGKIALVVGTTTLPAAACPGDDLSSPFNPDKPLYSIADFVGYGNSSSTTGHCYEGAGPAAAPSNTTADFRKAGGCVDTNENGADFFTASPNPRNSSSPAGNCQPEITINDLPAIAETNSGTVNATFTVSLSAVSAQTITVNFATADGTAKLADNDYQSNSGMLTFNPGDLSKPITVLVNGDTLDESNETFFVNLSAATNAVLLDNQGQGTINDDDPTPTLSINDVSQAEGDSGTTAFNFTVSLSAASGQIVTVNYATADNSASSASDYQSTSGMLTFNPGDTSKPIAVLVNGDGTFEPNESFFINLSSPVNATISDAQGIGTITNDDAAPPTPTFFITNAGMAEGNSGTTAFVFDVSLSPASSQTTSVDFNTVDGSATLAGNDYQSNSGTLTFAPGGLPQQITVLVNGDILVEPDETFTVHLSNATNGAGIGTPDGTGTILNDDGVAQVVISEVYGGGGNTSSPAAVFKNDFIEVFNRGSGTVDLTGWSVQYSSASGTGSWSVTPLCAPGPCFLLPGKYFLVQEAQGTGGTQNLPTPDATGTIPMATASGKVALVSNLTPLSGACPAGAILDRVGYGGTASTIDFCFEGSGPAPAPGNITADFRKAGGCTDNDQNATDFFVSTPFPRNSSSPTNNCTGGATPNLSIDDVTVAEGNSGTTTATFTVSLSAAAQGTDVTFDIATADGTATTANSDYVAKSLTSQIIPAGQTSYTFTVTVNGDTSVEPDETFDVNVSNVVGANVTDGTGTGTISNDDLPTLSVQDVTQVEGDAGTSVFSFQVDLSSPAPAGGVSFTVNTADGTTNPATAGSDYVAIVNGSGSISAGNSSTMVSVIVNGDTTDEPNETFFVNLSSPSNATIADGQGLGTIQNDDSPPTLSVSDVTQAEGNAGTSTFTFNVNLSAPAKAGGVSFTVNTADGTTNPATAGSDYVAVVNGSGSIAQGFSSTTVDVTVNGDTVFEPNETFFVNLTNVTGATVVDPQGLGTITNDDSQPTIAIADASILEGNSLTSLMTFTVTLTGTSQSNVTVDYATADSSATIADVDYDTAGGTLTFGPGVTSQTFTVTIHGDTNAEGDEMFFVNLTNPSGATISDNQALGTIFLDDPFSVAALNTAYTENFDTLAQSGNSSTTPTAWTRAETGSGANTTYTGNTGSSTTGDTYSYGSAAAPSDRALGGLRTGTLVPTVGAFYRNDTGSTVNALQIGYTGEEWRLGNAGRADRLDFQYSTNATSLTTGTWTDVDPLDFTTPDTTTGGAKDGNSAGERTAISTTITGLSIAPGATFWIRWTDFDASGSDDGLAVDDFSLTALNQPTLSIDDLSQSEGNSGTSNFSFTVHLSQAAPAGGVSFNFSTADGTTNPANAGTDYTAVVNGSGNISAGNMTTTVSITVNGDMTTEPNETFFVNLSNPTNAIIGDGQAVGTITNDDIAVVTKIVISQVYGGGGNAGATYKNDFIELFNAGNQTVSLTGWSVQYVSAGGTGTWATTNLSGSLAPGRYYLVQEGAGAGGTVNLPTPDAMGNIAMTATAGKVALVNTTTALSGSGCPIGASVVDLVGYGSGTNCSETAATSAPSNTTAVLRNNLGCTDTDNNSSDFTVGAPNPRNTASPANQCPGTFASEEIASSSPTDSNAIYRFARVVLLFVGLY